MQGEILVVTRHRSGRVGREPVIGIGPRCSKPGIDASLTDALGELGQLVTASLADGRERYGVPGQP
jgi:hypothetical protein